MKCSEKKVKNSKINGNNLPENLCEVYLLSQLFCAKKKGEYVTAKMISKMLCDRHAIVPIMVYD